MRKPVWEKIVFKVIYSVIINKHNKKSNLFKVSPIIVMSYAINTRKANHMSLLLRAH